jgi:hypothetical protein
MPPEKCGGLASGEPSLVEFIHEIVSKRPVQCWVMMQPAQRLAAVEP